MSDRPSPHPPLDPPGVDREDTPLEPPVAGSADPEAAFETARRIEADPALSPAGAQGASAGAGTPAGAAKGSNLALYLGLLVAIALLAAAAWAALR